MRKASVSVNGIKAGILQELQGGAYQFTYFDVYLGPPVSLTMPITNRVYHFELFPPFFEGLLPEGMMLEALLRKFDFLPALKSGDSSYHVKHDRSGSCC
jgi:serine/threonine-protein kinase HipA